MAPISANSPSKSGGIALIAVILKGYPRISETFIARELLAIQQSDVPMALFSLRHPTDSLVHPVHERIQAPVTYLPEYLYQAPLMIFKAWRQCRLMPGYQNFLAQLRADLRRDFSPNRWRRAGQACVLAVMLPKKTTLIYAHFIHTPASVAMYASLLTGIPWAVSAHAKDIWTSPDWDLKQKILHANWVTTCNQEGFMKLCSLGGTKKTVFLNRHGIDLTRLPDSSSLRLHDRNGNDPQNPVVLLSVGRCVKKKGFEHLIRALARLPTDLCWQWHHVGSGAELQRLKHLAHTLNIDQHICWHGSLGQNDVYQLYRKADCFILPSVVDRHGDRDGLPNVLVEAMGHGLPCIASPLPGISEILSDQIHGRIVDPTKTEELAQMIDECARNPDLRMRYGKQARNDIEPLNEEECILPLIQRIKQSMGAFP